MDFFGKDCSLRGDSPLSTCADCGAFADCLKQQENIEIPPSERPSFGKQLNNLLETYAGKIVTKIVFGGMINGIVNNLALHDIGEDAVEDSVIPINSTVVDPNYPKTHYREF